MTDTVGTAVRCPPIIKLGGATNFLHRLEGVMGLDGTNELEKRPWTTGDGDAAERSGTDHFDRTYIRNDHHFIIQNSCGHYLTYQACKVKILVQLKKVIVDYFLDRDGWRWANNKQLQ